MFVVEYIQGGTLKTAPCLFKTLATAKSYANKLMHNVKLEYIALDDYDASTLNVVPYHETYCDRYALIHLMQSGQSTQYSHAVVKRYPVVAED